MSHATLQDLLRGMEARGSAAAVIAFTDAGARETSFAELHRDALAVARALGGRGIGPGSCVAITGPNGAAWITAFWAGVASGATVLALDAHLGDEEMRHMLHAANARVVFAPAARDDLGVEKIPLDHPLPRAEGNGPPQRARAEDMALLLFTSGTTGNPKGVPLTHANLLSNVNEIAAARVAGPGDRALLPLPLHHAYPLTVGMLTAFAVGAALILPAGVSGPELIHALKDGRASVLMGVPRLYTALAGGIRQRVASRSKIVQRVFALMLFLSARAGLGRILFRPVRAQLASALRILVSGGAALEGEVESFLRTLGWDVLTGYGLTETSPILAFNRPGAGKPGSAGRPLHGVELRIENKDENGIGEIEARGPSVFAGYLGDEAATKRAFTPDGFFRTGDFGRIDDDGYLQIVARVAETIVLADGKKLFPEAIEAAYAHPFVKEIALFARDGALVALVVPDLDALREAGAAQLRATIRDALGERGRNLPSHARVTGFALAREKLPRTQLGKIRRHLIPALYDEALAGREPAAPVPLKPEDEALLEEPAAAAVWAWLKTRFPDHGIGLDMSPQLDLGIDSLGWVDLTLALERDHAITLTEHEIGRIVTVRDLLREAVAAGARPAPPSSAASELPRLGAWWIALRFGVALVRVAMRLGFRLRVDGIDVLPREGPYLICPNHESYLDPFAMAAALPARHMPHTWWAGWTGILYTTPLRRLFSRIAQIVPVDQYRGGGASLALAAHVFARGDALVWFPEGALTRTGKIERFQAGVGVLVARHKVPVVPARIVGSIDCWPVDSGFLGFRPIRVRFGQPLDPNALIAAAEGDPQRIADAIRDAVVGLSPSPA